jgi:hypothetical protein
LRALLFPFNANPATDRPLKTLSQAQERGERERGTEYLDEVMTVYGTERRCYRLGASQSTKVSGSEYRGSPEAHGCLTAQESRLNAEHRSTECDIARLAVQYEGQLERHIAKGRKGTPRACAVIAARVKTILSESLRAAPPTQSQSRRRRTGRTG